MIDSTWLNQSRMLHQQVLRGEFGAACELSAKLIEAIKAKLQQNPGEPDRRALSRFLFVIHFRRIKALLGARRPIEAMVNALRLDTFCRQHDCAGDQVAKLASKMSDIEARIRSGQVGGGTRRQLLAMLHPDKNRDLDEESERKLRDIFNMAIKVL